MNIGHLLLLILVAVSGYQGYSGQGLGWWMVSIFLTICLFSWIFGGIGAEKADTENINSPEAVCIRREELEEFERRKLEWQQAQQRLAEHERRARERAANPMGWLISLPIFTKQASDEEREWMQKG